MNHPVWTGVILAMVSLSSEVHAAMQDSTRSDPIVVAREVFQAYEAKRWAQVAQLADSEALAEFRDEQVGMAHAWAENPDLAAHGNAALAGFARIQSLPELEELSPQELFARWLEGKDPKPENYDDRRPPEWTRVPIGAVSEGPSMTHVVYRIHTDVGRFGVTDEIDVLTLKRTAEGWRFVPNRDLSFLGSFHVVPGPPP